MKQLKSSIKEYKTNGGNSYLDIKYSDYIAKNKIEESIKKTNKKQAKKIMATISIRNFFNKFRRQSSYWYFTNKDL